MLVIALRSGTRPMDSIVYKRSTMQSPPSKKADHTLSAVYSKRPQRLESMVATITRDPSHMVYCPGCGRNFEDDLEYNKHIPCPSSA
jgi:hypothetical protein